MPSTLETDLPACPRQPSPQAPPRRSTRRLEAAAIGALLIAAGILRFWQLGRVPGLNGDEAWYGVMALRWLGGEPIAWRTPTGNPLNPFLFLPLAGLHACFAPSIALLRLPAAISGVLACLVNYWFCSRIIDRRTALISTTILAVLPINLAYSRFAWDASQSLLATLFVLYGAAWRPSWRSLIMGSVLLAAAVLVHPTNIFAAPLVLTPWACLHLPRWMAGRGVDPVRQHRRLLVVCACCVALAVVAAPARSAAFALNYLRLLSGATVYRYISGWLANSGELPALRDFDLLDAAALVFVAIGMYGFIRLLREARHPLDRALAWGTGLKLAGFYLVAGPAALQPHVERYAIVLLAPTVLVLSRGIGWHLAARPQRSTLWCAVTAGWLLLGSFCIGYFHELTARGGDSHVAFRTAYEEPKQAAIRAIQAAAGDRPAWVVVDEWWLYWPFRYLAGRQINLHVVRSDEVPQALFSGQPPRDSDLWLAQFCESAAPGAAARLERHFAEQERRVFRDAQGRPLIDLTKLQSAGDR